MLDELLKADIAALGVQCLHSENFRRWNGVATVTPNNLAQT